MRLPYSCQLLPGVENKKLQTLNKTYQDTKGKGQNTILASNKTHGKKYRLSKTKEAVSINLPPKQRVLFLKDFFTTGGTPPAREQSARAESLLQLYTKDKLPLSTLARQLKRFWGTKE